MTFTSICPFDYRWNNCLWMGFHCLGKINGPYLRHSRSHTANKPRNEFRDYWMSRAYGSGFTATVWLMLQNISLTPSITKQPDNSLRNNPVGWQLRAASCQPPVGLSITTI